MGKDNDKKTDLKTEKVPVKATQSSSLLPASPFDDMQREMDRLFDNFLGRAWLRPSHLTWPHWGEFKMPELHGPKVDIIERDDEIVIQAEIPGIDKKDIDISVTSDTITIKGQTEQEKKEETGNYHRREISRESFTRTLNLPSTVDSEKAKASFKDGILKITLPKAAITQRRSLNIE